MLDLIVLGIVPGTSFTITLWWVLLVSFILSVYLLIWVESSKVKNSSVRTRTDINLELINPNLLEL